MLFKNCDILQRDINGHYSVLKNAFLGISDKTIDYIGTDYPKKKYDAEKDMSGKLLIPGLVNAHGHAAMTLVRGVGSGLPLDRWLNEAIFPIEAKMIPEDIAAGTRWAVMEMLSSGTTLCSDMYDFPIEGVKVFSEAGMKVNTARELVCFDPSLKAEDCERLKECEQFIQDYDGYNDDLVRADVSLHSEYLTTENTVKALAKMAKKYKSVLQLHVSETQKEHEECKARHNGLTPVQYLEKMGILDTPTYMAHCVWIEEKDMQIMKEKGCSIVHNPSSNMKLASGFAPIPKALEMGINVCLGTDGVASNNNLNMFEELHCAALIHKGKTFDPTILTVDQLLDMATINGAKALGRFDTGLLETGKKADIAAIDLNRIHLKPAIDIPALLCYSAQASDVCMTMVNGKILYENGNFYTIDVKQAEKDLLKAVERLL